MARRRWLRMANDEFREQQQASREVGLKARHETRVERAIRRDVANEIAAAILGTAPRYSDSRQRDVVYDMERIARDHS